MYLKYQRTDDIRLHAMGRIFSIIHLFMKAITLDLMIIAFLVMRTEREHYPSTKEAVA